MANDESPRDDELADDGHEAHPIEPQPDPVKPVPALAPTVREQLPSSNSSARWQLRPRDKLGPFVIKQIIGRGGMGVVYEAVEETLDRRVALKVLPPAALMDETQIRRFRNEASAAAQLSHPHIVPVYSIGSDCGVHYYAMQLIAGRNLSQVVASIRDRLSTNKLSNKLKAETLASAATRAHTSTALNTNTTESHHRRGNRSSKPHRSSEPWREVGFTPFGSNRPLVSSRDKWFKTIASLGRDAAQGVAFAHDSGVVHRDIKPSNLLLDDQGKIWITDFGLAHLNSNPIGTATGDIVGTYRYMSPEQASGRKFLIDHRTDIYSLGATLYELLALQPAFSSDDPTELLRNAAFDEPLALRKINPQIPVELETIVIKAMAKNPHDRYVTAHDLSQDLERFCNDQPIAAKPPTVAQRMRRWATKNPTVTGMLAVAVSMTFLVLALYSTIVSGQYQQVLALNNEISELYYANLGELYSTQAMGKRDRNPGLALALAREALKYSNSPAIDDVLQSALETNRELKHLQVRSSPTQALSLSSDGRILLSLASPGSGAANRVAIMTDLDSGKELRRFQSQANLLSAEFSPDATRVITVSEAIRENREGNLQDAIPTTSYDVTLWDTNSGNALQTLPAQSYARVSATMFDKARNVVVLPGPANQASVIRLDDFKRVYNIVGHLHPVVVTAVSADSEIIATADSQGEIRLWQADDAGIITVFSDDEFRPSTLQFTSDSQFLLASGTLKASQRTETRAFRVTREASGDPVSRWPEPNFEISPGRNVCAAFHQIDTSVRIRDIESGKAIVQLPLDEPAYYRNESVLAAFASPYELAVASGNNIAVFNILNGERRYDLAGHTSVVRDIVFSGPLQRWVSCSKDNTIRTWHPLAGAELMRFPVLFDPRGSDSLSFAKDAKSLLFPSAYTHRVKTFDFDGEQFADPIDGLSTSTQFFRDRLLLLLGDMLQVVDATSGRVTDEILGPDRMSAVYAVGSSDYCLIQTFSGSCYIWRIGDAYYEPVLELGETLTSMALASGDGRFAVGTDTGKCRIFNSTTGLLERTIPHPSALTDIQFLADKRVVTVDEMSHLRVWGDDDVVPDGLLREEGVRFDSCCVDVANNFIFTYRARRADPVVCWNVNTLQKIDSIEGQPQSQLVVDSESGQLFQASRSKGILVWNYGQDTLHTLSHDIPVSMAVSQGVLLTLEVQRDSIAEDRWFPPTRQTWILRGYDLDSLELRFERRDLELETQSPLCVDAASPRFAIPIRSFHATIFDLQTRSAIHVGDHRGPVSFADFQSSNAVITASWDGTVSSWSLLGEPERSLTVGNSVTAAQRFGSLLACGLEDASVALVDLDTWSIADVLELQDTSSPVVDLHFSSDGQHLLACYADDSVVYWSLLSRTQQKLPPQGNRGLFLPDSNHVLMWHVSSQHAFANSNTALPPRQATIVDASSLQSLAVLPDSEGTHRASVSADGQRIVTLAGSRDWNAYIKDAQSGEYRQVDWTSGSIVDPKIQNVCLSPSGRFVAIAETERLQIFDLDARQKLFSYDLPNDFRAPNTAASWQPFAKDESWIAFATGRFAHFRSLRPRETISLFSERQLSDEERKSLSPAAVADSPQ